MHLEWSLCAFGDANVCEVVVLINFFEGWVSSCLLKVKAEFKKPIEKLIRNCEN